VARVRSEIAALFAAVKSGVVGVPYPDAPADLAP
jgi:hypothetical protein